MSSLLVTAVAFFYRRSHGTPEWPASVERVLVIRLDLLGDVLFSMQAVEGLRRAYPHAHISILTLPYTAPLARLYDAVDEVLSVDTNRIRRPSGLFSPRTWTHYWRSVRQLREQRFDLAVSLSGPMASLWGLLSGAGRTVGYAGEAYPFTLTDPVAGGRYDERKHEVEYVRTLAQRAGGNEFPERLRVPVLRDSEERVEALLGKPEVSPHGPLVVVHAGSTNGSAKRWPTSYWSRFADEIQERIDARVILVGAASDEPIAREVMDGARSPLLSLVGRTTIEELVALIDRADLVATGDSGPLHLAVARGRPLLAVYGPTDPYVHGPFRPAGPTAIHRKDLACSPCYTMANTAECPLGNPICMQLVTVKEMVESAVALLQASPREPRSSAVPRR